jgi:hypothetical protein
MGWSREQIAKYENKLEAARTSDTITNRAALVWNKRYGMDAELYLAFPSTQFTPFKLETSDKLYVKIDSPVEISD